MNFISEVPELMHKQEGPIHLPFNTSTKIPQDISLPRFLLFLNFETAVVQYWCRIYRVFENNEKIEKTFAFVNNFSGEKSKEED